MTVTVSAPPHRAPPRAPRHRRARARACRGSSTTRPAGWTPDARTASRSTRRRHRRSPSRSNPTSRCSCPGRRRRSPRASARRVRVQRARRATARGRDPSPRPTVETGLLRPGGLDRAARRRDLEREPDVATTAAPRSCAASSHVRPGLVRARLYATAHGLYEAEINGARVGDDALSPGWTVYRERLRYYTYDVTELLADGRQRDRRVARRRLVPRTPRLARRLPQPLRRRPLASSLSSSCTYADGTRETIATDADVEGGARARSCAPASTTARTTTPATSRPAGRSAGFDDSGWEPRAAARPRPAHARRPDRAAGARAPRRCRPVAVLTHADRHAHPRLRPEPRRPSCASASPAPAGTTVTPAHRGGAAGRRALHAPAARRALDRRLHPRRPRRRRGVGAALHLPRLPLRRGRRLARRSRRRRRGGRPRRPGAPHRPRAHRLVRLVRPAARTACTRTSCGACAATSSTSPPTARSATSALGWTGDIQVFAPTASFLYDVSGMLARLAPRRRRRAAARRHRPLVRAGDPGRHDVDADPPGAAWGDVATLTPWTLYERFGDVGVLRAQFDSARRWVDLHRPTRRARPPVERPGFQLGDWLDPAAPPQDPADARTDRYLVATAYFAQSARTGRADGRACSAHDDEAAHYAHLADEVRGGVRGARTCCPTAG